MKHVLLVGATDGIGRALAEEYLSRSWRVGIIGRKIEKMEQVASQLCREHPNGFVATTLCDVADTDHVGSAFEDAVRSLGQVDLFVYCVGVMESPDTAPERGFAGRRMLEVNAGGAIQFLELAAEYLSDVGKGQIAAIGSVAGDRGRRGNPAYCASKAALHNYLQGLRNRLHRAGITVSTIKPGWVQTRMLKEEKRLAIDPRDAAHRIAEGLRKRRDVVYVPGWWRIVAWVLRAVPGYLFKRLGPK